jgi:hypothetical protein
MAFGFHEIPGSNHIEEETANHSNGHNRQKYVEVVVLLRVLAF